MTRNSKILAITFAMLTPIALCHSQDQAQLSLDSSIAMIRANMRVDRTTLISQGMNFSDKEGAAFWPIYRRYEYERSAVDDRRVAVIKEYFGKYKSLSDADAKAMTERMLDCEARLTSLKKKYYREFSAVLPPLTATRFLQLEHRIDLLMDARVEAALPPLTQPQVIVPAITQPQIGQSSQ